MWNRGATAVMSVLHEEKRSRGLMRSKVSLSSEKCGNRFWRKAGPDNQVVVLREAAATDLDPWSAG